MDLKFKILLLIQLLVPLIFTQPTPSFNEYPGITVNNILWISDTEAYMLADYGNTVYFSNTEGTKWDKVAELSNSDNPVTKIVPSRFNPKKVIFLTRTTNCFITENAQAGTAASYQTITLPVIFNRFTEHSYVENYFLGSKGNELYFSKDFGKNWQLVITNLYYDSYSWGNAGVAGTPDIRVYYLATGESELTADFCKTDDFGKTKDILVAEAVAFAWLSEYVLVGIEDEKLGIQLKVAQHSGEGVHVGVSVDHFHTAQWPDLEELQNTKYTIFDDVAGGIWVGVGHSDPWIHWGTLFQSGRDGIQFTTSQKHIRKYGVSAYDLEPFKSLKGVYISNNISNYGDEGFYEQISDKVETYISFNNGGEWNYINPPKVDSQGRNTDCLVLNKCHLHLHGLSSYFGFNFGPVYTLPTATGLVIGTGNIGAYLSHNVEEVNTYLSTDGGITWVELLKGNTIYEFGDRGGIIVMADFEEATDTIYYTLDEGKTVKSLVFTSDQVWVQNIVTEPTASSNKFILYGTYASGTNQYSSAVITLDFSTTKFSVCQATDYEEWTPHDETSSGCLLGEKTTYKRKIPTVSCFTNKDVKQLSAVPCECTREDYECDFGFSPDSVGHCKGVAPNDNKKPEQCSGTWYTTQGYRLIAGDNCEGGLDLARKVYSCNSLGPSSSSEHGNKSSSPAGIIIAILLVIVVLAVIFLGVVHFFPQKMPAGMIAAMPAWLVGDDSGYKSGKSHFDDDLLDFNPQQERQVPNALEDSSSGDEESPSADLIGIN